MSAARTEYPRPQFRRDDWQTLNGEWSFAFDDRRAGLKEKWQKSKEPFARTIQVPFPFESKLSGIGETEFHSVVWYSRSFQVPQAWAGRRIVLHFGAADYQTSVWVNGELAVTHEGGHTPFFADITDLLRAADNRVTVRCEDNPLDLEMPRGKQYWKEKSASIFYTRTTGIWQPVWLEAVPERHLAKVRLTPDLDRREIAFQAIVNGYDAGVKLRLRTVIAFEGRELAADEYEVTGPIVARSIRLRELRDHGPVRQWSPETPNLYDISFTLFEGGQPADRVDSYFGMRKVSIENGRLCLNNRPYFLRFALDQGYFPDGILTGPSDEAYRKDVELAKQMGFNGVRKHQKVEDPRFLYWADKLGLLVWGEMANAYDYSAEYVRRITREWQEAVDRDYNHPCIMAWVPLNESWGVPDIQLDAQQQHHARTLYHLTKSLDSTRPVVSNDGWEMVETDLFAIHDYQWRRDVLERTYADAETAVTSLPANRQLAVGGHAYAGQPILVTEFGGIAFKQSEWEGWGYSGASDEADFLRRLRDVVAPLVTSPVVQGFCYTQLTDVEQEINGLLTYERKPKAPLEKIREIIEMKRY